MGANAAEHRRQFKMTAIRTDNATGIGITEYSYPTYDTTLIHSLYYDTRLSNRDMIVEACKLVTGYLNDGECARLYTAGMNLRRGWYLPYSRIIVKGRGYNSDFYGENKQLAEDALERKTTILEEMRS